jgi:hypothetical protein
MLTSTLLDHHNSQLRLCGAPGATPVFPGPIIFIQKRAVYASPAGKQRWSEMAMKKKKTEKNAVRPAAVKGNSSMKRPVKLAGAVGVPAPRGFSGITRSFTTFLDRAKARIIPAGTGEVFE